MDQLKKTKILEESIPNVLKRQLKENFFVLNREILFDGGKDREE